MSDERPIPARLILIPWLCGLSSLLYIDRLCMSMAADPIAAELELSKSELSLVHISFTLAYGFFAVPAGKLGDRFGPRLVLASIVGLWSIFTGLTGLAVGLGMLLAIRFLFGISEAGAYPNAARVIKTWYPLRERGRVQGVMLSFGQVGGIVAPAATGYLIEAAGWRVVFFIYGAAGLLWAAGWWIWFRDDPSQHRAVTPDELDEIRDGEPPPPLDPGPVPWGAVFRNRGILLLGATMVLASFFTYFFYSWFPKYLKDGRGTSNVESGWLMSLAIGGSLVGMLIGGWVSDRISKVSVDPVRTRRRLCSTCFVVSAAFMFVGTRCETALDTSLLWCGAMLAMHIQLPNWWSTIIPQSGKHTATIFGLTNGVGVLGAAASQAFVGFFADFQEKHRGLTGRDAWDPIFDVYVLVLLGGAVTWWLYRFTPLEDDQNRNPV
jgi:ACS family glucarate transporter-like MFS transporter